MHCPYCHKLTTFVKNSRPTGKNSQVWRRRFCPDCRESFTTHENVDLSHLVVIKNNKEPERFSRAKLYSGIYGATIGSKLKNREFLVEGITKNVERDLLFLKKKRITSEEITDIVLAHLKIKSPATFLRFLAYNKNPQTGKEVLKEVLKYLAAG